MLGLWLVERSLALRGQLSKSRVSLLVKILQIQVLISGCDEVLAALGGHELSLNFQGFSGSGLSSSLSALIPQSRLLGLDFGQDSL